MTDLLPIIGVSLAIAGSILSVVGTLYNNLKLDHGTAMMFWQTSNPMLFVWAVGVALGYWNGGLSIGVVAVMYLIFTVTNFYGLFVKARFR